MRRAAIVSPLRTAVGKFQGALSSMTAGEIGGVIIKELVERTKIDPERIDDVTFAHGYPNGEAPCIARWSLLQAGLPIGIPGVSMDRRCGSGLQAIVSAAQAITLGDCEVAIGAGHQAVEHLHHIHARTKR